MRIAFDLDGTLADSYPAFRKGILTRTGWDCHPLTRHSVHPPEVSESEVGRMIADILLEYNRTILPYNEIPKALKKIHAIIKKPIMIVTARQEALRDCTEDWYRRNLPVPVDLNFVQSMKKRDFLVEKKIKIWVDDRLLTANHISKEIETVFLLDRIWNQRRRTQPGIIRAKNLNRIAEYMEKK